jgi:hypothetical protein
MHKTTVYLEERVYRRIAERTEHLLEGFGEEQ